MWLGYQYGGINLDRGVYTYWGQLHRFSAYKIANPVGITETIKLDAEAVNNLTGDDGSLVISIAVFGKLKSLDKGIILDEDELVNGKLSIYNLNTFMAKYREEIVSDIDGYLKKGIYISPDKDYSFMGDEPQPRLQIAYRVDKVLVGIIEDATDGIEEE